MNNILKVIKINFLSILALPLLLIAIVFKLFQKALEKALVFVGVAAAIFSLFIINALINEPGGLFNNIVSIISIILLMVLFFGIVLAILFVLGVVAASIFKAIMAFIMNVANIIFELFHKAYTQLFDICKSDYKTLSSDNNSSVTKIFCIFWHLLRIINFLITNVFALAFAISMLCVAGFVTYSLIYFNIRTNTLFGVGIISYLKLFTGANIFFAILDYTVFVGSISVAIISLGKEWSEWGKTLKFATQDYTKYIKIMKDKTSVLSDQDKTTIEFESGKSTDKCNQYINVLNNLLNNLSYVEEQIDSEVMTHYDSSLTYDFAEYVDLLNTIVSKINKYDNQIPAVIFEKSIIPLIDKAVMLEKAMAKSAKYSTPKESIKDTKQISTPDFFAGCTTQEELAERYSTLCKVYGDNQDIADAMKKKYNEFCTDYTEQTEIL